ncbi:MAG: nuclear transport factor 2 family protein [Deltaproteobacteria bacterium]|nr:nuclear transport factor 2 family protein [Deltaproteobacteria bacterium]
MRRAAIVLVLLLAAAACSKPAAERDKDIEAFLTSYFSSWSAGDMRAYRAHFHDDAVISFVKDGVVRAEKNVDDFVRGQASVQRRPGSRLTERMLEYKVLADEHAASVEAFWELDKKDHVERGIDRFTLVKTADGEWKIVSLLFYKRP